jgi:hypothetical protein
MILLFGGRQPPGREFRAFLVGISDENVIFTSLNEQDGLSAGAPFTNS